MLTVAMPKCPICWMGLMSALGVSSVINKAWLRPLAIMLLLLPVIALFVRARRRGGYGPFVLGIIAAAAMYFFKFELFYDPGVYLSGAALVGASIGMPRFNAEIATKPGVIAKGAGAVHRQTSNQTRNKGDHYGYKNCSSINGSSYK